MWKANNVKDFPIHYTNFNIIQSARIEIYMFPVSLKKSSDLRYKMK